MIKAAALKLISPVVSTGSSEFEGSDTSNLYNVLTKKNPYLRIEYSEESERIPRAVENYALRMFEMDAQIRDFLTYLRSLYTFKAEDFQYCMKDIPTEAKSDIIRLCQHLYGVMAGVRYCADRDTLKGKLVLSPKSQGFITGQYMEIAIRKIVRDVLSKLEQKYGKQFKLYANTKVVSVDGKLKNEFDLIIENVADSLVYVVEVKSGDNFDHYEKLAQIGREYGIVPNRLLLIQNYRTEEDMETIEHFCDYYFAPLEPATITQKLITMMENDL